MVSEGGAVASEGQRNKSRGARVKVCNIVLRCSCSFTCYTSTKVRILTEGGRRVMLLCRQMAFLPQEMRKEERMGSVEVCATRQAILRGCHKQCVCMCGLCVCVCVCCERERALHQQGLSVVCGVCACNARESERARASTQVCIHGSK
jgi:hypothetical protein